MKLGRVGMRNIKTAISVSICVALSHVFNREYIFYAVIASVIAMQSSVADSFKAGKNRMLGTIVGALAGFMFASIKPGNVFLCGIGVVLIIYICDNLGWKKSVTISCIVFLAIMLNLNDRTPMSYSINRIVDTFIGISVAVLVNYFVSPPRHTDKIYEEYILTIDKIFSVVEEKLCHKKAVDLKYLNNEIINLEEALNAYLSEFRINQHHAHKVDKIGEVLDLCKDVYMHIKIINSIEGEYSLNETNAKILNELFNYNLSPEEKNNKISTVYNYHVDKVIDSLVVLKKKI